MPKVSAMPATAYARTIATIRDYPRMKFDLDRMRRETGIRGGSNDGMPKGTEMRSSVEDAAIKMADAEAIVNAIEQCITRIPADMQKGILDNIIHRMAFPRNDYAQMVPSYRSWQREKRNFVVCVAHKLRIY